MEKLRKIACNFERGQLLTNHGPKRLPMANSAQHECRVSKNWG